VLSWFRAFVMMADRPRYLELRCRGCLWNEVCGPAQMVTWLREAGKVRQGKDMELEILYEVFRASAPQFRCPKCDQVGLAVTTAVDVGARWPGAAACVKCGRPIAEERLQAVPGTNRCAACQGDQERGIRRPDKDFCPRCGAPMEVRAVTEGMRTRYVLGCSANPPCPL